MLHVGWAEWGKGPNLIGFTDFNIPGTFKYPPESGWTPSGWWQLFFLKLSWCMNTIITVVCNSPQRREETRNRKLKLHTIFHCLHIQEVHTRMRARTHTHAYMYTFYHLRHFYLVKHSNSSLYAAQWKTMCVQGPELKSENHKILPFPSVLIRALSL